MNKATLNSLATACAALALALAMVPATAQEAGRTRVGTLTCNISPGVGLIVAGQRQLSCIYTSARGRAREAYGGTVSTLGLDIGATSGGRLTWAVFAPTTLRRAALAGTYAGVSAGGTVGAGVGANVLVGGSDRTVALQPVSVQAQTGVNIAASLHFVASVPNSQYFEYCVEQGALRQTLTKQRFPVTDGEISVPEEPGLGVELDEKVVEKYRVG